MTRLRRPPRRPKRGNTRPPTNDRGPSALPSPPRNHPAACPRDLPQHTLLAPWRSGQIPDWDQKLPPRERQGGLIQNIPGTFARNAVPRCPQRAHPHPPQTCSAAASHSSLPGRRTRSPPAPPRCAVGARHVMCASQRGMHCGPSPGLRSSPANRSSQVTLRRTRLKPFERDAQDPSRPRHGAHVGPAGCRLLPQSTTHFPHAADPPHLPSGRAALVGPDRAAVRYGNKETRFQISDFKVQVSNSKSNFQVSRFRLQTSNLKLQTSNL